MRTGFTYGSRRGGIILLAAVNGLNATDALLTEYVIKSGWGVELNPVASALGAFGKLALVGVASYLLFRIHPRALLIPTVALGLVVGYQMTVLIFSS